MSGLPPRLGECVGTSPQGPNCWNATQMFHDEKIQQGYTSPGKMNNWLRMHTEQVTDIKPHDILVFRADGKELLHTAVALTSRTLFHKKGCWGPYEVLPRVSVVKRYGDGWTIHRMKPTSD